MDWERLTARSMPTTGTPSLDAAAVTVALVGVALVVAVPPLWQVLRLAVTLVHELGHAAVGVAAGRRFTGFVLRGDMSGHAVTVGPSRGPGRVLSTWAGYPAPALVGAALVHAAGLGWAAPVATVALGVLLVALVRVRTLLTAVVTLAAIAATAVLWWRRDDVLQAQVLLGLGLVLLVGAWRHLAAVARTRVRLSDPAVLASLTHVPRLLWTGSFAVVCAVASWLAASDVVGLWR